MSEKETTRLYNGITGIDEDIIEGAQASKPQRKTKSPAWIKWGAMAACLAVIAAVGIFIPWQTNEPLPPAPVPDEAIVETANLNIYYLSETGTIDSKSVEVDCSAEDIFKEWAKLNHVSGVTLVECIYDDNGTTEHVKGDTSDTEATIKHTVGNFFTLTITLSTEFSRYAESEHGDLLTESLRQTFYDYIYFDEFNLSIAE